MTNQSPAEGLRQQIVGIFDSFHNHTCQSCKGSGCINCRNTGMNQTPCLVCDEDGIAYRRRKKHVDEIMELVTAYAATVEREARLEHLKALAALAGMYGQYCDGPFAHDFMGAGEDAIEILENYKLAKEDKGVDYEAVTKLEREIDRLAALRGPLDDSTEESA